MVANNKENTLLSEYFRFFSKKEEVPVLPAPLEPTLRQFLIAYTWSNDISKERGTSSLIVDLDSDEKLNAEKLYQLQSEILERISTLGIVNDPDAVVITGFYLLDEEDAEEEE